MGFMDNLFPNKKERPKSDKSKKSPSNVSRTPARPPPQPPNSVQRHQQESATPTSLFGSLRKLKSGVATSTPKEAAKKTKKEDSLVKTRVTKKKVEEPKVTGATGERSITPIIDSVVDVDSNPTTSRKPVNPQVVVRRRGKENVEQPRRRVDQKDKPQSSKAVSGISRVQEPLKKDKIKSSTLSLNNVLRIQPKSIQSQQLKPKRPVTLAIPSSVTVRGHKEGQGHPDNISRTSSVTNLESLESNLQGQQGKGAKPRKTASKERIDKQAQDGKKVTKNNNKLEQALPPTQQPLTYSSDSLQEAELQHLRKQLREMSDEKSSLALQLGEQRGQLSVLQKEIQKLKTFQDESSVEMDKLAEENTALRNRLRDVAHSPLSDNEKQQLLFESRHHSSAPASIATNVAEDNGGDATTCTTPDWDKHSSSNVSEVSVACLQDKINQMQETHYSTNEELQATLQELTDLQRQLTELQQENERLNEEKTLMFDSLCRQTERLTDSRQEVENLKQFLYRDRSDETGVNQLESAVEREQKLVELLRSAQEEREQLLLKLEQMQAELHDLRAGNIEKAEEIAQQLERVRTLECTLDAKHAEHKQLDQELAQAKDQCSGKQIEINRLTDLLENARTKINELEQDRTLSDKSELDELLDNARKEKDQLESDVAYLKEQLARSKNEIEKLKEQVFVLQEECKVTRNNAKTTQSDLEYKCEKLVTEKNTLGEQLQQFQEAVNELQVQAQCHLEDKRQLSAVLSETQRNLSEAERRNLNLETEIQELKKLRAEENDEWEKFQNDLLTSVRVANDFKTEAQQELQKIILENKTYRERLRLLEGQLEKLKGDQTSVSTQTDIILTPQIVTLVRNVDPNITNRISSLEHPSLTGSRPQSPTSPSSNMEKLFPILSRDRKSKSRENLADDLYKSSETLGGRSKSIDNLSSIDGSNKFSMKAKKVEKNKVKVVSGKEPIKQNTSFLKRSKSKDNLAEHFSEDFPTVAAAPKANRVFLKRNKSKDNLDQAGVDSDALKKQDSTKKEIVLVDRPRKSKDSIGSSSSSSKSDVKPEFFTKFVKKRDKKISHRKNMSVEEETLLKSLDNWYENIDQNIPDEFLSKEDRAVKKLKILFEDDQLKEKPVAHKPKEQLAISKPLLNSVVKNPKLDEIVRNPRVPTVETQVRESALEDPLLLVKEGKEGGTTTDDSQSRIEIEEIYTNIGIKSSGIFKSQSLDDLNVFEEYRTESEYEPVLYRAVETENLATKEHLGMKTPRYDRMSSEIDPNDSVSNPRYSTKYRDVQLKECVPNDLPKPNVYINYENLDEIVNNVPKNVPMNKLTEEQKFALKLKLALDEAEKKNTLKKKNKKNKSIKGLEISGPTEESVRKNWRLNEILLNPRIKKAEEVKSEKFFVDLFVEPERKRNSTDISSDIVELNELAKAPGITKVNSMKSKSYEDISFSFVPENTLLNLYYGKKEDTYRRLRTKVVSDTSSSSQSFTSAEFNLDTGKITQKFDIPSEIKIPTQKKEIPNQKKVSTDKEEDLLYNETINKEKNKKKMKPKTGGDDLGYNETLEKLKQDLSSTKIRTGKETSLDESYQDPRIIDSLERYKKGLKQMVKRIEVDELRASIRKPGFKVSQYETEYHTAQVEEVSIESKLSFENPGEQSIVFQDKTKNTDGNNQDNISQEHRVELNGNNDKPNRNSYIKKNETNGNKKNNVSTSPVPITNEAINTFILNERRYSENNTDRDHINSLQLRNKDTHDFISLDDTKNVKESLTHGRPGVVDFAKYRRSYQVSHLLDNRRSLQSNDINRLEELPQEIKTHFKRNHFGSFYSSEPVLKDEDRSTVKSFDICFQTPVEADTRIETSKIEEITKQPSHGTSYLDRDDIQSSEKMVDTVNTDYSESFPVDESSKNNFKNFSVSTFDIHFQSPIGSNQCKLSQTKETQNYSFNPEIKENTSFGVYSYDVHVSSNKESQSTVLKVLEKDKPTPENHSTHIFNSDNVKKVDSQSNEIRETSLKPLDGDRGILNQNIWEPLAKPVMSDLVTTTEYQHDEENNMFSMNVGDSASSQTAEVKDYYSYNEILMENQYGVVSPMDIRYTYRGVVKEYKTKYPPEPNEDTEDVIVDEEDEGDLEYNEDFIDEFFKPPKGFKNDFSPRIEEIDNEQEVHHTTKLPNDESELPVDSDDSVDLRRKEEVVTQIDKEMQDIMEKYLHTRSSLILKNSEVDKDIKKSNQQQGSNLKKYDNFENLHELDSSVTKENDYQNKGFEKIKFMEMDYSQNLQDDEPLSLEDLKFIEEMKAKYASADTASTISEASTNLPIITKEEIEEKYKHLTDEELLLISSAKSDRYSRPLSDINDKDLLLMEEISKRYFKDSSLPSSVRSSLQEEKESMAIVKESNETDDHILIKQVSEVDLKTNQVTDIPPYPVGLPPKVTMEKTLPQSYRSLESTDIRENNNNLTPAISQISSSTKQDTKETLEEVRAKTTTESEINTIKNTSKGTPDKHKEKEVIHLPPSLRPKEPFNLSRRPVSGTHSAVIFREKKNTFTAHEQPKRPTSSTDELTYKRSFSNRLSGNIFKETIFVPVSSNVDKNNSSKSPLSPKRLENRPGETWQHENFRQTIVVPASRERAPLNDGVSKDTKLFTPQLKSYFKETLFVPVETEGNVKSGMITTTTTVRNLHNSNVSTWRKSGETSFKETLVVPAKPKHTKRSLEKELDSALSKVEIPKVSQPVSPGYKETIFVTKQESPQTKEQNSDWLRLTKSVTQSTDNSKAEVRVNLNRYSGIPQPVVHNKTTISGARRSLSEPFKPRTLDMGPTSYEPVYANVNFLAQPYRGVSGLNIKKKPLPVPRSIEALPHNESNQHLTSSSSEKKNVKSKNGTFVNMTDSNENFSEILASKEETSFKTPNATNFAIIQAKFSSGAALNEVTGKNFGTSDHNLEKSVVPKEIKENVPSEQVFLVEESKAETDILRNKENLLIKWKESTETIENPALEHAVAASINAQSMKKSVLKDEQSVASGSSSTVRSSGSISVAVKGEQLDITNPQTSDCVLEEDVEDIARKPSGLADSDVNLFTMDSHSSYDSYLELFKSKESKDFDDLRGKKIPVKNFFGLQGFAYVEELSTEDLSSNNVEDEAFSSEQKPKVVDFVPLDDQTTPFFTKEDNKTYDTLEREKTFHVLGQASKMNEKNSTENVSIIKNDSEDLKVAQDQDSKKETGNTDLQSSLEILAKKSSSFSKASSKSQTNTSRTSFTQAKKLFEALVKANDDKPVNVGSNKGPLKYNVRDSKSLEQVRPRNSSSSEGEVISGEKTSIVVKDGDQQSLNMETEK